MDYLVRFPLNAVFEVGYGATCLLLYLFLFFLLFPARGMLTTISRGVAWRKGELDLTGSTIAPFRLRRAFPSLGLWPIGYSSEDSDCSDNRSYARVDIGELTNLFFFNTQELLRTQYWLSLV